MSKEIKTIKELTRECWCKKQCVTCRAGLYCWYCGEGSYAPQSDKVACVTLTNKD